MRLLSVVLVVSVVTMQASAVAAPDAAALLGQPVVHVTPAGPERDEDSGGQLTYCTYRAATSAVVVSVVEFSSAGEARKQLTRNLVQQRMDAEDAKISEEPGVGEKSFHGVSARGAMMVFLKKGKVVGVGVGGSGAGKATASRESLRSAAQAIASKIQRASRR